MNDENLEKFSRQLARWTHDFLAKGRFPFRRVEIAPSLLTEGGEESPSLVFWINRESFMAGGILLLPSRAAQESTATGRRCAQALGLRHFATWAPREIAIWEAQGEEIRQHRTIDIPETSEPAARFQQSLGALLEEFKILSVLGAVSPEALSDYYFANLGRATLEEAISPLVDSFLIAQGENRLSDAFEPEQLAREKSARVLFRLLGLLACDRLPPAIQPEGLEKAMFFALESLPEPLSRLLSTRQEEPLPSEAAVRFHHFFRRLFQLRFAGDRRRGARVLDLLLAHLAPALGAHPLPFVPDTESLLVHSAPGPQSLSPAAEVASPAMLMGKALLRELHGMAQAPVMEGDVFSLPQDLCPRTISGTLFQARVPAPSERRSLAALLRTSWPNRRFALPPRSPRWVWECLHLLGLSAEGASITLRLPMDWLVADWGLALWDLLRSAFILEKLRAEGESLVLVLRRGSDEEAQTHFSGPFGSRRLPWGALVLGERSQLALALYLPPSVFSRLSEGSLLACPEHRRYAPPALRLFARSSLGALLWRLVSGGMPLPAEEGLSDAFRSRGMPLPSPEIVSSLSDLGSAAPDVLDREVNRWLPLDPGELVPCPLPAVLSAASQERRRSLQAADIAAQVTAAALVDGLPLFPEHYLYDHFRPDLQEFTFSGPLVAGDEFFGQITLRDPQGRELRVQGWEKARALELASYGERGSVSLPIDRDLTSRILQRYCRDLHQLHQALARESHLRMGDARSAERLVRQIWKDLPLPPWNLVESLLGE